MTSRESKFMVTEFMTNVFTIITRSAAPYLLWLLPLQRSFLQNPPFFQACQRLRLGLAGHLVKDFKTFPYLGNSVFPLVICGSLWSFSPDSRLLCQGFTLLCTPTSRWLRITPVSQAF